MSGWHWALLLRPLFLLLVMYGIVGPIKWALLKIIPDGRVKRVLLTRLN